MRKIIPESQDEYWKVKTLLAYIAILLQLITIILVIWS